MLPSPVCPMESILTSPSWNMNDGDGDGSSAAHPMGFLASLQLFPAHTHSVQQLQRMLSKHLLCAGPDLAETLGGGECALKAHVQKTHRSLLVSHSLQGGRSDRGLPLLAYL